MYIICIAIYTFMQLQLKYECNLSHIKLIETITAKPSIGR